jgi:type II secretory pathway pseudopilin PulG
MKRRRRDERGFVMLLVFLMAAIVGIMLYSELPRVSFESQRAKEELLVDRGEQYKRAIQVFVKTNKKYPASIQELESFNNHRYLRKQYVDPMTGKKEWRLVHVGPGGTFTDSLVNKPPKDDKDKDKDKKDSTTTQNYYDPNNPNATGQPQGPTAVPPRRQSEMGGLMPGGVPGQRGYTGQPPQIDPATGQPITQPGVPGQPGSVYPTGVPGYPGQPVTPGQPGQTYPGQTYPGQPYPGQPGQVVPGQPYPAQPGQVIPGQSYPTPGQIPGQPAMPGYPYSTQPGAQGTGAPPFQQPGYQPTTGNRQPSPTAAQDMIQKLLTQPRPGGAAGQAAQPQMGQTIGGGIAGVASTADEDGIKVYNDHTNYKEWEFIYDYTKDKGPVGAQTGANGTPAADLGTAPGAQPGQTPATGPGQPPGTSPFGTQQPGGFGQPNQPGIGMPVQQPRQ